jgi:hypothetical protein
MTKKTVGIVDPWRTVDVLRPTPVVPSPAAGRRRINLDEIDHDADLAIPGQQVLRFEHASFNVTSKRIKTSTDAFHVLVNCVADLSLLRSVAEALQDAGIGVRVRNRTWNMPSTPERVSTLQCETSCLWFSETTVDGGTHRLARIMRSPPAAPALRQHGITVMLTTG